jgi:putative peptidoglycan lipid II flippase
MLIPVSAIMMALSTETIAVVFQRGRFTEASTMATAPVLQWYLVGSFAFAAMTIVTRCFYAMQNTLLPMVVSTLVTLVCLPIYGLLRGLWDAPGIAVAGSVSAIIQLVVMTAIWVQRHGQGSPVRPIMTVYVKALMAGMLGYAVAWGGHMLLWKLTAVRHMGTLLSNLTVGVVAGSMAMVAAYGLLITLGVDDVKVLFRKILQRRS